MNDGTDELTTGQTNPHLVRLEVLAAAIVRHLGELVGERRRGGGRLERVLGSRQSREPGRPFAPQSQAILNSFAFVFVIHTT